MANEVPLAGGRVTAGVVRIGATVRRPRRENSVFVRALLAHLEESGFDGAPRHLGTDEGGREVFSFQPGVVPPELDPTIADETLEDAARLIRRYHDATAGSELAGESEVACHNDLSPCNFVFREGRPVAIIDFDAAAPGDRVNDLGYALFLWLNLGTDGPPVDEQVRRLKLFCDAYGISVDAHVFDAIVAAVAENVDRLRRDERFADAVWWHAQLEWLEQHRAELEV
jgi:Ser/Thr protein kinase RdoA (MazF antagonist)